MSAEIPGQLTKQEEEVLAENVMIGKTVKATAELLSEEISKLSARGIARLRQEMKEAVDEITKLSTGKKPVAAKPDASQPMTEAEAREFAATKIAFGKYDGFLINNIPLSYLEWLTEQPDQFKRNVRRYLDSPVVRHIAGMLADQHDTEADSYRRGHDEDTGHFP